MKSTVSGHHNFENYCSEESVWCTLSVQKLCILYTFGDKAKGGEVIKAGAGIRVERILLGVYNLDCSCSQALEKENLQVDTLFCKHPIQTILCLLLPCSVPSVNSALTSPYLLWPPLQSPWTAVHVLWTLTRVIRRRGCRMAGWTMWQ